mgnify:CR=1 FL=1
MIVNLRKLIVVISLMISLSIFGVVYVSAEETGEEDKKVSTFDQFLLGSWVSFYDPKTTSYEEQLEDIAASGMNLTLMPRRTSQGIDYYQNTPEFWNNLDLKMKELNSYYLYQGDNMLDFNSSFNLVKDLENAIGYHLKDEPSAAQMPALSESFLEFSNGDKTRFPFVNLYPNYAGASNLGGSYRDYINLWVNNVGANNLEYLYFDHYPFTQTEAVRSSYFSDLEVIRDVAYNNKRMKTGGFTQMGSWNGMTRPTVDMARWSVYSLLTYGLKSISHFNWVAPEYVSTENGGEGMRDFVLSSSGEETDLYEPMQILNWQVRQLGPILMGLDVKHAYHTANVPNGTEELPSSFILQPENDNDDFIYSIAFSKDDSEVYLLVFNKSIEGEGKDYQFKLDLSTGIEGLTYYKPTEFSSTTLPDPKDISTLENPQEIYYDVKSGKFTSFFKPGEMKIFKVEGDDVKIYEDLSAPESSHKKGTYVGSQTVSFNTGDLGAKIYYTLDGSFPIVGSANTYLYTDPIIVGKDKEFSTEIIRAISIRGEELSEVTDVYLYITDASKNISQGIIPEFKSLDMNTNLNFKGFNGSSDNIKYITDGSFDPESSVISLIDGNGNNAVGWSILDLKQEYTIEKLVLSFWHDWTFNNVKVEAAKQSDFSDAIPLFEGSWKNVPYVGTVLNDFEPINVRYIRVTNSSVNNSASVFTEIQVYSNYEVGQDLISKINNWQALGGSSWDNDGRTINLNGNFNTLDWDRAYGFTEKKYKNFMLDATMKFNISDPSAWGYAGFGLYRPNISDVQSNYNQGYYIAIEPKGRALIWNGAKPELGPEDANIANWSLNSEFNIRIISYNDTLSLSVNNVPIMFVQKENLNREAGYISIHAGLIPITITSLRVSELDESMSFDETQNVVKEVVKKKIAVERYVSKADVISQLGSTVTVIDSKGLEHEIGINWASKTYDRSKTGTFKFIGTLNKEDLSEINLVNPYLIEAEADVFIKSEIDTSDVEHLLEIAYALNQTDFTVETWNYLQIKIEAAEAILEDEFLVQSDINVGMFQLYDAIYGLENILDKTDLVNKIKEIKAIEEGAYTNYSYQKLQEAIKKAEEVRDNVLASSADIAISLNNLNNAKKALETKIEVIEPLPAPVLEKPVAKGCKNNSSFLFVFLSLVSAFGFLFFRKK